jgi:8-oxo-dGTP diphosphatase
MVSQIPWKIRVTLILTNEDGKVLLGKRKGSHGAGTWGFVGGHLEPGEDPRQACRRELKEETGITLFGELRPVGFTLNEFLSGERYIDLIFLVPEACTVEPALMEPNKCEGWKWFNWDELPEPLFLPIQNYLMKIRYPNQLLNQIS